MNTEYGNTPTHEDEGRVQVLVIFFRIISVKLFGFSAVYGEEVGSGIVGPEGFKELLEGGMEASKQGVSNSLTTTVKWVWRTTLDRSVRPPALPAEVSSLQARAGPSAAIVARVKSLALDQPPRWHWQYGLARLYCGASSTLQRSLREFSLPGKTSSFLACELEYQRTWLGWTTNHTSP
jgi:hypothetical protein